MIQLYRTGQKNGQNDAEAICEAEGRKGWSQVSQSNIIPTSWKEKG
jgi:hypothetical protein